MSSDEIAHPVASVARPIRGEVSASASQFAQSSAPCSATGIDFVATYADYADVLEAPRLLHECVGIQIVASALNRNRVTIPNGAVTLPLDLWVLLLSGSGAGRSTTAGMAGRIIDAAGIADLRSNVRWGSAPALSEHFSNHPCGLEVWGEMAERLKLLNQPNFETAKEWLTDRYDNLEIPASVCYRSPDRKRSTPPIVFKSAPRINILATSSDAWFFDCVKQADSMGGFLPRWLLVRPEIERRDIAVPRAPDPALVEPLGARLREIANLIGPADLSPILADYQQWYTRTKTRFLNHPNSALADAYFNRHRNQVLKVAVVFEASESATLAVSQQAWRRAAEFMLRVEEVIFRLLPTDMCAQGFLLQRMEEKIKRGGKQGISKNELTRAFQSMKPRDRADLVTTLEESGLIVKEDCSSNSGRGGRPKEVYIHAEFRTKFRQP